MAMSYSHTQLVYKAPLAGPCYIDVTRGLSLINGKNCSQFSSKDKPMKFFMTIRASTDQESVFAAKDTWVVRNSCVKAAAAWRRTLRSAGIRRKQQLNTYARNMRLAWDHRHSDTWSQLTAGVAADLIPKEVDLSYNSGQYQSTGSEVQVVAYNTDPAGFTPWGDDGTFDRVYAFTQTTFAVPQSGSVDVLDKKAQLLGDKDTAVPETFTAVVAEYIDSRINDAEVEDTDLDASPSLDNDFVMMLAPGEEVADDVLDNVDDEGKWRPYSLNTSISACQVITPDANVAGQDTVVVAPLGLLKWDASAVNSQLTIDIVGYSDM